MSISKIDIENLILYVCQAPERNSPRYTRERRAELVEYIYGLQKRIDMLEEKITIYFLQSIQTV